MKLLVINRAREKLFVANSHVTCKPRSHVICTIGFPRPLILIFTNRTEFFCGNSGNYYLSISSVKSMFLHLISDFNFWGPFQRENGSGRHAGAQRSGASKPNQKKLAFWVTCYLKIVFPNFQTMDFPLPLNEQKSLTMSWYRRILTHYMA